MKSQVENHCGKKDLLVAYLYAEASPAESKEFEWHQAVCVECRTELQAFQGVRQELSTWEMPFVPHIEVVTPRTAMDALRDFFRLVPGWFKITAGLATAAAAALIVLAFAGTHISYGQNGVAVRIGVTETSAVTKTQPIADATKPIAVNSLSRAEAEQMIQAAVAQAQAQAQHQFASLEAKLTAAHQMQLQNATAQLRKDQQKQLALQLVKLDSNSRQSLTEWLLTAAETEEDKQEGARNEKNQ